MRTINSKELRSQLDYTFDRVIAGEDVIITHRFKKPVKLTLVNPVQKDKKELAGLASFDAAKKKTIPYDKTTPLKKLYKEHIEAKYGK